MYYAYLLQLVNNEYYSGSTVNLKNRFREHSEGRVNATKNLRPLKLVFYAAFVNKERAIKFERYLKSSSGFAFRNKHFV